MYEQQEYEEVQVDESENCNKVTKLSALDEIDEAVIPLNWISFAMLKTLKWLPVIDRYDGVFFTFEYL